MSLALDPVTLALTAPEDSAAATMDMRNVMSSLDGRWPLKRKGLLIPG